MSKIYTQINKEISAKQFMIPIYLDTEGESINAFEVRLKFSNNLIFRDYLEKDSIVSYWIEKPHVVEQSSLQGTPHVVEQSSPRSESEDSTTELVFSGIIPGGYIGKKGLLVNLVFEAKPGSRTFGSLPGTPRSKETSFSLQGYIEILPSSQVLLNDGLGTKAELKVERYEFLVKPSEKKKIVIQDNYPPEPFKIYLQRNKEIFNGKYYIVFDAKDKQSGIAYYEVKEGDYNFEKTQSPYVLKDQSLRSYIYVKAVDRAGNERIEVLRPQRIFLPEEILLLGVFAGLVIFGWLIYNKRYKK